MVRHRRCSTQASLFTARVRGLTERICARLPAIQAQEPLGNAGAGRQNLLRFLAGLGLARPTCCNTSIRPNLTKKYFLTSFSCDFTRQVKLIELRLADNLRFCSLCTPSYSIGIFEPAPVQIKKPPDAPSFHFSSSFVALEAFLSFHYISRLRTTISPFPAHPATARRLPPRDTCRIISSHPPLSITYSSPSTMFSKWANLIFFSQLYQPASCSDNDLFSIFHPMSLVTNSTSATADPTSSLRRGFKK